MGEDLHVCPLTLLLVLLRTNLSHVLSLSPRSRRSRPPKASTTPCKLAVFLAEQAIHGERAAHKGRAPPGIATTPPVPALSPPGSIDVPAVETAKSILDTKGPEAMAAWVRQKKRVMVTDTTMRDAHQVCFSGVVERLEFLCMKLSLVVGSSLSMGFQ